MEKKKIHQAEAASGPGTEKIAYRLSEAVEATGLSRSLLYKLIAEKKLQAVRVGKCRLILAESLRALIASQK